MISADVCDNAYCNDKGSCQADSTENNAPVCFCPPNFGGDKCDSNINLPAVIHLPI